MNTLQSLAELGKHFDTAVVAGSRREQTPASLRPLKAYPDNLPIGSIVYMDASRALGKYEKDTQVRPGLVTALWRDAAGALRKIEVADMTTQVHRIYPNALVLDTEERRKDFGANKAALVATHVIHIADNTTEYYPRSARAPKVIPESYWPDLILRRADAILHNWNLRVDIQGSLSGLTRVGIFFPTIKERNTPSHEFVPEISDAGFGKKPWLPISQHDINRLANYVDYYHRYQGKALAETGQFPPPDMWLESIPRTPFRTYDKLRDYSPPCFAAE
jgi:hypothetical protein